MATLSAYIVRMESNYIKRLQRDNAALLDQVTAMQNSITEFRVHLASDKFAIDPTIQVADVQRWLDNVANTGIDAFLAGIYKEAR
jgi:hypothetical protein